MAQGGLRGTLTANGTSQVNPSPINGSIANVAVGDLVYAVWGEQTTGTMGVGATNPTDNLGNTYAWCSAATDPGTPTARAAWSIVTAGGTLTQVRVAATASGDNYANFAAVIEGPFKPNASQPAANPANGTNDITSPFTCPATGVLPQANCVVMAFFCAASNATFAATSPNLLAGQATSAALVKTVVGYQMVAATTTVSPAFTGTNPTGQSILGTTAFLLNVIGTGALAAQDAGVAGTGVSSSTGTGALAAQSADVVGTSPVTGTGTLAAQDAAIAGAGISSSTGTGGLDAQPAAMVGVGVSGSTGGGTLAAQAADVQGSDTPVSYQGFLCIAGVIRTGQLKHWA